MTIVIENGIEYYVLVNQYGTSWNIKGTHILHREDGPAYECFNGDKFWYKYGNLHRDNGPALEYASGDKYWYKKGKTS